MKPNTCEVQKRAEYSNGAFVLEYPSVLDMAGIDFKQIITSGRAYFLRDRQNKPLFVSVDQMRGILANKKGRLFNLINLNTLPVKEILPIYRKNSRHTLAFVSRESLSEFGMDYLFEA